MHDVCVCIYDYIGTLPFNQDSLTHNNSKSKWNIQHSADDLLA